MAHPKPEAPVPSIGLQMRLWRSRRGLSQTTAAVRAGITQATWSNYETCKREPSVTCALRIAAALDVTLAELIDGSGALILLRDSRLGQALEEAAKALVTDRTE